MVDLEEVFLWQFGGGGFVLAGSVAMTEADWAGEVFIVVRDVDKRSTMSKSRAGCWRAECVVSTRGMGCRRA